MIYFVWNWYQKPLDIHEKIKISSGGTFYDFLVPLSPLDTIKMKLYIKQVKPNFSALDKGIYIFSWMYNKEEFVDMILEWPKRDYISYTILEGWSSYDIDFSLQQKDILKSSEYLDFITNTERIAQYRQQYSFLPDDITSLEGFLYPDTYNIDRSQNFLEQLVYLQLETFKKKVWNIYQTDIENFHNKVQKDFNLDLDRGDAVILASIVEKEERNNDNKPTVAWIFLKRLGIWMRLDADITLCYGLKEPYETCTPTVISSWIYDENNIFNTRKHPWILPQSISNPASESFFAVLNYNKTDYLYYLHDNQGGIHYGKTSAEHSSNKRNYLN